MSLSASDIQRAERDAFENDEPGFLTRLWHRGATLPGYGFLGPFNTPDRRKVGQPSDWNDALAEVHDHHYGFYQDHGLNPYVSWNMADSNMLNRLDISTYGGALASKAWRAKRELARRGLLGTLVEPDEEFSYPMSTRYSDPNAMAGGTGVDLFPDGRMTMSNTPLEDDGFSMLPAKGSELRSPVPLLNPTARPRQRVSMSGKKRPTSPSWDDRPSSRNYHPAPKWTWGEVERLDPWIKLRFATVPEETFKNDLLNKFGP